MATNIKDKLTAVRTQRKLLKGKDNQGNKKALDIQINDLEQQELSQRLKDKQDEHTQLISEARTIIKRIYGGLRRLNIINSKQDMSQLFNRSKSFFMVFECRDSQGIAYEDIRTLKDNIQEIRYNLDYFLEDNDPTYTEYVKRKLGDMVEQIERLEYKIIQAYYGIV